MPITVNATGLDAFEHELDRIKGTYILQKAFDTELGDQVRDVLRRFTPIAPFNGGALRKSLRYRRITTVGEVGMEFYTEKEYAPFLLEGTKAHGVDPSTGRTKGGFLWMHWVGGSGDVFAKWVSGIPANYWQPALAEPAATLLLQDAIQSAIEEAIAE